MGSLLIILVLATGVLLLSASSSRASTVDSSMPEDSIMASAAENLEAQCWVSKAFLREKKPEDTEEDFFISSCEIPFSFSYEGVSSKEFLENWNRTAETKEHSDWVEHTIRWSDPKALLLVTAKAKVYKRYPAVDWVLNFENQGKEDTPILENIQAANMVFKSDTGLGYIHSLNGDKCDDAYGNVGQNSFLPIDTPLYTGRTYRYAPDGGRSSSMTAPYFNYEYAGQGTIIAIGWTGQWAASFTHTEEGPTQFQAGMERTHLLLHPGEKIRTPRILILSWKGDRVTSYNRFRRLILEYYSPKENGKPVQLPIALQVFDRYESSKGWATEQGQIECAKISRELGCDAYWLDAAWFEGGFPNGVGNWYATPANFPNGIKPISDACHQMGMKFILWFEPERVADGTQVDREHPEWVLRLPNTRSLFNLSDPAARRWLTDLLLKRITEYGIDIYRNDFNLSPLNHWRQNDAQDRQGITEIRYIEGLYEMWDELLRKNPGLVIDNCASGGRRIDIETSQRSVLLWRSDSSGWDSPPEWNQVQSLGLSLYVPLNTAAIRRPDAMNSRSAATGGAICELDYMSSDFSMEMAKAVIAEARENRKYWYGDIYSLTNCNIALDHLQAFQLHRPDLKEGIILAFRRANCEITGLTVPLHGINTDKKYSLEFIDDELISKTRIVSGKELVSPGLNLMIEKRDASLLIRYKELPANL